MENASKALIMAGSILMSLLVIGLLVFGYTQISDLEQQRTDSDDETKLTEYTRQFEQFNRTLYGSELLSLANLQEDYNKEVISENDGYSQVEIQVETKGIAGTGYFSAGTKSIESFMQDAETIEKEIEGYEQNQSRYNNKSVKYYANRTYREIAIDFNLDITSMMSEYEISDIVANNAKTKNLYNDIQNYETLNSIYTEFKTGKRFRCTDVKYDDNNGRITEMFFEEI